MKKSKKIRKNFKGVSEKEEKYFNSFINEIFSDENLLPITDELINDLVKEGICTFEAGKEFKDMGFYYNKVRKSFMSKPSGSGIFENIF
jgi:hypothetical protein